MKFFQPLISGLVLGLILLPRLDLQAQTADIPPLPPTDAGPASDSSEWPVATVTFASQSSIKRKCNNGIFPLLGIQPGEQVDIAVQYSTGLSDRPAISADALDGGTATTQVMGATGLVRVHFQAGHRPGNYRVVLAGAGLPVTLRFWVSDPANAKADPRVVKPRK